MGHDDYSLKIENLPNAPFAGAAGIGILLMTNGKFYEFSNHARESLRKRPVIRMEWIEQVLKQPQLVEIDTVDAELEHRLGHIEEYDGRVLRVIAKKDTNLLRIITFYFDRRMRRRL